MKTCEKTKPIVAAVLSLCLGACGGAGNTYSVGGTVGGLNSGQIVTLADNGSDSVAVSANGAFQFPTALAQGATYNVTIQTQPAGQTCQVVNGAGQIAQSAITNVSVACAGTSSIGGTVSGLASGASVTLGNGTVYLPIAANGAFAFPGTLTPGTAYQISVQVQPIGQACVVTNGSGVVSAGVESVVTVTCS